MWNEKTLKIIPALLFLFVLLEIFQLVLVIEDMNKTEKLEKQSFNNLEVSKTIIKLLNEHLEGSMSSNLKDKNKYK
ncbi:hypothetical protein HPCU_01005 [Helicobacter pylori Cuz20]|uniref:Uncharacterized protein n=1 Tax=Helicobacter pylori (strain Cuz20) TaxID=765964 RepID=A0AB32X6C8_HELPC|nr:hypothetical protein [Helicobacter pylori]ADO03385.1 hypothetical protein HPCU_01005 [Helicobacter pylori Cuz20]